MTKIAVLGGGHGCYAAAAEMAERSHEVWFWRRDASALRPLLEKLALLRHRGLMPVAG